VWLVPVQGQLLVYLLQAHWFRQSLFYQQHRPQRGRIDQKQELLSAAPLKP
jgi:hypothetical protein